MCRNRPGPRCSDHSHAALEKAEAHLESAQQKQAELSTRLETLDPESKRAAQVKHNLEIAAEDEDVLIEKYEQAQLEYDATPRGQTELRAAQQQPDISEEEKADLQDRIHMAQVRREWQRRVHKHLQMITRRQGADAAALWAFTEMQQAAHRFDEISQEILAQAPELDAPVSEKTPHRSNRQTLGTVGQPRRVRAKQGLLKRGLKRLMRQRFLYALIVGDLDKYLVNKFGPDRLFRLGVSKLRRRFV